MKVKWWHIGLLIALGVAFLSPLASSAPDGLERVAENEGFLERARDAAFNILPGYSFPGVSNDSLATIMAGVVGTLLVFALAYVLAWFLRGRRPGMS
jgi:hypothetical protein